MFVRLVKESFVRNPRRKLLAATALVLGIAVATATLSVALEVGDRMAREFRSLGANLLVTPQADTLPLQIGGVDYRPVNEGAYLNVSDLGKLKMIFWRHNILGFAPFLDVPATTVGPKPIHTTLIGTWYEHQVPVPDGSTFQTGVRATHPWWKIRGRWFDDDSKECVVGATFAANYPGGLAPGKIIELASLADESGAAQSIALTVTGIVSTGGAEDNAVLAPLAIAQQISGHGGHFRELFVSALTKPADAFAKRDPRTMNETEYDRWYCSPYVSSISLQITQALPGTSVRTIRRVADTEGRVLSRISSLLWIVTLAALAAAILAVAATSAATVLERREEIGIMKAIGASNSLVSGIFLSEQLLLALIGGTIGYIGGAALARVLGETVFGSPAPVNFVLFPIVLGIAAAVAVIGSLVPLRRAAHLDPAPILRGE